MTTAVLQRRQAPLLVYLAAVGISLPAGTLVAKSQHGVSLALLVLLGLAGLVVLISLPIHTLFLGWLFLAPLFQVSADESAIGAAGVWAIYTVPALLFIVVTLARSGTAAISASDFLPLAYLVFVLASFAITNEEIHTRPIGALRGIFLTVGIGIIVYYFLTLGPGSSIPAERIVAVMLAAAFLQGLFAVAELFTGWHLWPSTGWDQLGGGEHSRVVATLANPAVLGVFLGSAIVTAVAVLTYRGPSMLRRPSIAVLAICVPGLLATLTRAPIAGTLGAVLLILIFGRLRYVALAVLATAAIVIFALLPSIQASELYQKRVNERTNIRVRSNLQDWSLRLWEQRPILGFGHGRFDDVKRASGFSANGVSIKYVRYYTSHNTYLTTLVELGLVGFILYVVPFFLIGYRGIARARSRSPDQWLAVACLGSLFVLVFTSSTIDFRFFSIALMLPWLYLALLRRMERTQPPGALSG